MAIRGFILTGCAGFIGLNFLEKFVKDSDADYVISIDKMGYATTFNSKRYYELCSISKNNISPITCDINDVDKLKSLCDVGPANEITIVNFASESHVDNSIKDPFLVYTQNASIPANLLKWIGKDNWHKIKKFNQISTDEIYGEIPLHDVKKEENWFKSDGIFKPSNPYSASKAAQDCFLMSMNRTFNIPVRFIRMANQFGKWQHPEKMLPASIMRIIRGETIKIYGNGKNIRQWTDVEVTAKIINDLVNSGTAEPEQKVFHIANRFGINNNNTIVNYLQTIMTELGYKSEKEYIEDRKGHDSAYALSTTPDIDDYFKTNSLGQKIKETAEFYIKNKDLYLGNLK